jgi:hypothetical protein
MDFMDNPVDRDLFVFILSNNQTKQIKRFTPLEILILQCHGIGSRGAIQKKVLTNSEYFLNNFCLDYSFLDNFCLVLFLVLFWFYF